MNTFTTRTLLRTPLLQRSVYRQIATSTVRLDAATAKPKKLSDAPVPTPRPIYPPANNPFAAPPSPPTTAAAAPAVPVNNAAGHSPLKIAVVKALAKMMGYNTKSVTAIRETGNMVGEIVRAVERDHEFWYGGKFTILYWSFMHVKLMRLLVNFLRLRSATNIPNILPTPPSLPPSPHPAPSIATSKHHSPNCHTRRTNLPDRDPHTLLLTRREPNAPDAR
jgi:cytochrome b pre-mRNA-processing protein 3